MGLFLEETGNQNIKRNHRGEMKNIAKHHAGRQYLPVVLVLYLLTYPPAPAGAAQFDESETAKNAAAKGQTVSWMLAGKEGACAPLSLLEKKSSEFRGIESPDQLAKKMRDAGHKVEVKQHNLASRPAVEVRVPERDLYVMFVKANLCDKKETAGAADQKRSR